MVILFSIFSPHCPPHPTSIQDFALFLLKYFRMEARLLLNNIGRIISDEHLIILSKVVGRFVFWFDMRRCCCFIAR